MIAASAERYGGKDEDARREQKKPYDDVHVYLADRQKLAEADRQKLIERDRAARQAAIDDAKGRLF